MNGFQFATPCDSQDRQCVVEDGRTHCAYRAELAIAENRQQRRPKGGDPFHNQCDGLSRTADNGGYAQVAHSAPLTSSGRYWTRTSDLTGVIDQKSTTPNVQKRLEKPVFRYSLPVEFDSCKYLQVTSFIGMKT